MERLIDFLTSNFYYVIIAVGLIYGMFFRKSSEEPKRPNRPNRMPDFGGGGQRPERPSEVPPIKPVRPGQAPSRPQTVRPVGQPARESHRPAESLPSRPKPEPYSGRAEDAAYRQPLSESAMEPMYVEPAAASGMGKPSAARHGSVTATASPIYAAEASEQQPTRDDLARAIVWAEILGPPRTKKPYRR